MDALSVALSPALVPGFAVAPSHRVAAPAQPRSILVVDDHAAVRQATVAMLGAAGYHAIGVADSLTALCALVEHRPAAVVLDADNGPLPSWQLAQLVQQHPEHAQVRLIYASAVDDVIERAKANAAHFDGFLAKPFTLEELQAVLSQGATVAA